MTADEVRTFAERHIEHWKALDAAAIAADHAPDGVVESPSAGTHQGHEAICKALQKWFDSFPDMRFPTEQIVADADAMRRSSSSPSRERSRESSSVYPPPASTWSLGWSWPCGSRTVSSCTFDVTRVLASVGVIKISPS